MGVAYLKKLQAAYLALVIRACCPLTLCILDSDSYGPSFLREILFVKLVLKGPSYV